MTRLTALLILLGASLLQLVWLISVWRRDGFAAAAKLFLFACLSGFIVAFQYEIGL